jgi:hypothetical protein
MNLADIIEQMYCITGRTDVPDEVFAVIRENYNRPLRKDEEEWLEKWKAKSVRAQKLEAIKFIEGLIKLGGDIQAEQDKLNWQNRKN